MNDPVIEEKWRSHGWGWYVGWTLVLLFVVYPLSIFPADLSLRWLEHWGMMSDSSLIRVLKTAYWPVIWMQKSFPAIEYAFYTIGHYLQPLTPPR